MENGNEAAKTEESNDAKSQEVKLAETPVKPEVDKPETEKPKNGEDKAVKDDKETPEVPEVTPQLLGKIKKQVEVLILRFLLLSFSLLFSILSVGKRGQDLFLTFNR